LVWLQFRTARAAFAKRASDRAYRERNRTTILEQKRAYRERHRALILEQKRAYRERNRAAIRAADKLYRQRNQPKIIGQKRAYREHNREHIAKRDSEYKRSHRAQINANKRRRTRHDVNFRMVNNIRKRIHNALRGRNKAAHTLALLGCTADQCHAHLEKQFVHGMSWDNRADWHIDHIRPIASYDLTDPQQQRECFHYTNLQPLWAKDNLSKGAKYTGCRTT